MVAHRRLVDLVDNQAFVTGVGDGRIEVLGRHPRHQGVVGDLVVSPGRIGVVPLPFTAEQREERAEASIEVVKKMLEILEWFEPRWWCIENPGSSALWRQPIMQDLPTVMVSYCMYGFKYRKNTRLATTVKFDAKKCDGNCGNIREFTVNGKTVRRHLEVAKQGVDAFCKRNGLDVQTNDHKQDDLYRVPERLIRYILAQTEQHDDV